MSKEYKNFINHALADDEQISSAKNVTIMVYILQAISLLVGFLLFAAVIINYVKKGDVAGTMMASHFRWQIRTFWYSLLWTIIGFPLTFVGVGYVILSIAYLWLMYRIIRGWLRLNDNKAMYVK
jgi:uncharacterized membrane protein